MVIYGKSQERIDTKMREQRQKQSNIFRVLRLCMGLSLNDMAKKCGVSAVYLNELERGIKMKPSDQILDKIAVACGIRPATLHFFIENHDGKELDYQEYLLRSLEEYAQSVQEK